MTDQIIRGVARGGRVRFFVAKTTETVKKAQEIHQTYPATSAALGRVMSVAAIMGNGLKSDHERLVVEIKSDGDLNHVLVQANNRGEVRGLVSNPHAHAVKDNRKLDVGGIIGTGSLRVTYKSGNEATFSSQVELQTGEIGEDFAYYYLQSEQIPSAVSVGVLVNEDLSILSAGSILIQVLPEATEEDIVAIEKVLSTLPPVSTIMIDKEALEVASHLFEDAVILETHAINYFCGCNREQMENVLRTLNKEDLEELIEKDNGATLECQYCNKSYHFDASDIGVLIREREKH